MQRTEERIVETNGIQIAYEAFGNPSEPPVILVMGLGMQMLGWDDLFCKQLANRGYWVVRFDNRDSGHSTKLDILGTPGLLQMMTAGLFNRPLTAPYLLKDMAHDTVGLMNALGVRAAHIVGASLGGMIAQEMAICHPDRLLTMTSIMSTTGDPHLPKAKFSVRLRLLKRSPASKPAYVNHIVGLFKLFNGLYYPFDEARYRRLAANAFERGYYPAGVVRQLSAVIASGSRKEKLRSVNKPTLIVHGDADPLVPLAHGKATAQAIPNARLHVIRGLGHTLPEAAWPELIKAIDMHAANLND